MFQVLEALTSAPKENLRENLFIIFFFFLHPREEKYKSTHLLETGNSGRKGMEKKYTWNYIESFNHHNLVSAATNRSGLGKNSTKLRLPVLQSVLVSKIYRILVVIQSMFRANKN